MDDKTRIQLDKMLKQNNTKNTTEQIRSLKHSKNIKKDIDTIQKLKLSHSRLRVSNPGQFKSMCKKQASFLYSNYMNIFTKLIKDELDLDIMKKFLQVLRNIEEGHLDQHEGSYKIGTILKELYVDSAIKNQRKREMYDKKNKKSSKTSKPKDKISWKEYKLIYSQD